MGLELKIENTRDWVYMHEMKDGEIGIVLDDDHRIVQCYKSSLIEERTFIISLGYDGGKSWSFTKNASLTRRVKILPKGTELVIN